MRQTQCHAEAGLPAVSLAYLVQLDFGDMPTQDHQRSQFACDVRADVCAI